MARSFNGSSAYLEAASAVVTAEPFTMAAWGYSTVAGGALMSIGTSGGTERFTLEHGTSSGCVVRSVTGTTGTATSGLSATGLNAWAHYAGVFTSTTSRTAYFNGTAGTVNTTSVNPTAINRTLIGCRITTTPSLFFSGRITQCLIWSAALTSDEISALYRGFIIPRQESLVFNNPLDDRWIYDRARGLIMSDVGPTGAFEDPAFLQKYRKKYFIFGEAGTAPASVIFRNRTGSRARLIA